MVYRKITRQPSGRIRIKRHIGWILAVCVFLSLYLNFIFILITSSPPINNTTKNTVVVVMPKASNKINSENFYRYERPPTNVTSSTTEKKTYTNTTGKNEHENNIAKENYPTSSMSACLLIRDDNQILNEWIAYHYHALRLRYLVVAVDPNSTVAPDAILEKWQNETDLAVKIWSDSDYFFQENHLLKMRMFNKLDALEMHRLRQRTFLSSCYRHMVEQKKTWVMHVDTDEYVTINPFLRRADGIVDEPSSKKQRANPTRNPTSLQIPSIKEPSSIYNLLQEVNDDPYLRNTSNYPCISMPRVLFGSVIDENEDHSDQTKDTFTTSKQLQTQLWTFHSAYDDDKRNGHPKIIVDVSVVPKKDQMFSHRMRRKRHNMFTIHQPSAKLCRERALFPSTAEYPLSVNHYLGSWELYNARNDTRRNATIYNAKANVQEGQDRWIMPWLSGFVETVGREKAKLLLES